MVLTLVSCGLLVTYSQLGGQARKAFHRLTLEELASSGGSKSEGSHAPEVSHAGARGQSDEHASTAYSLMTCGAVLGLLGLAAVLAVRKRRAVVTEDELPPEPVAKVSDSPGKTMSKDPGYLRYLRQVFGLEPAEKV